MQLFGLPVKLPNAISRKIIEDNFVRVNKGTSGAFVCFINSLYGKACLKIQPVLDCEWGSLKREADVLSFLQGRTDVPDILAFDFDDKYEFLLTERIDGITLKEAEHNLGPQKFLELYVNAMLKVHKMNWHALEGKDKTYKTIEIIRQKLIKNKSFYKFNGIKYNVLKQLTNLLKDEEDLVFSHGDFCPVNIMIKESKVAGIIDWGKGCVFSRYWDLAMASFIIEKHLGKEHVYNFFKLYGLKEIDYKKLNFFSLLTELLK